MSPCCEKEELEVEEIGKEYIKFDEAKGVVVCQSCGSIHGFDDAVVENENSDGPDGEVME